MYLNKVTIIGNLTRDPELKTMPNGSKVTTFSVATNRTWKTKDGGKGEEVEFHNVVVFGRQAETSAQYLKKGQSVLVQGRLKTQSWEDKGTGKKMYRTEIVAESVQFGSNRDNTNETKKVVGVPNRTTDTNGNEIQYPDEDINPEDIPFK